MFNVLKITCTKILALRFNIKPHNPGWFIKGLSPDILNKGVLRQFPGRFPPFVN